MKVGWAQKGHSVFLACIKNPSSERALRYSRPTDLHFLSSHVAPDCLSPLSSTLPSSVGSKRSVRCNYTPLSSCLRQSGRWTVGGAQTDSVSTVFQAWWTERCWSRWSGATGCRVLRAARSRCTKWCGSAGRRSQTSGPLSNTSSPSWRTILPPLSHSTSPETTCRDLLRDPETHHHVLISHREGSQTHCGTSSLQLPCTLVLTEMFLFLSFFPPRVKLENSISVSKRSFHCRYRLFSAWGCVCGGVDEGVYERVWSGTTSCSQSSAGVIPCIADRGSCETSDELSADGWFTVAQNQLFLSFFFFIYFVFPSLLSVFFFTWTLNLIVKSVFILKLFIFLFSRFFYFI